MSKNLGRKNKSIAPLNVAWEVVEDPNAEEILRRVLKLILNDANTVASLEWFREKPTSREEYPRE